MDVGPASPGAPAASEVVLPPPLRSALDHHIRDVVRRRDRELVHSLSWVSVLAHRVHYSKAYLRFHVAMFLINLVVLLWAIFSPHGRPSNPLYVALEIFIIVMLLLEIGIRVCSLRSRFFAHWGNIFDLCVTTLCCVSLALYFRNPSAEEFEDVFAFLMSTLRYAAPSLRLVTWFRNRRGIRSRTGHDRVDFTQLRSFSDADTDEHVGLEDIPDQQRATPWDEDDGSVYGAPRRGGDPKGVAAATAAASVVASVPSGTRVVASARKATLSEAGDADEREPLSPSLQPTGQPAMPPSPTLPPSSLPPATGSRPPGPQTQASPQASAGGSTSAPPASDSASGASAPPTSRRHPAPTEAVSTSASASAPAPAPAPTPTSGPGPAPTTRSVTTEERLRQTGGLLRAYGILGLNPAQPDSVEGAWDAVLNESPDHASTEARGRGVALLSSPFGQRASAVYEGDVTQFTPEGVDRSDWVFSDEL